MAEDHNSTESPSPDFATLQHPQPSLLKAFPACEGDPADQICLTFAGVHCLCPITGQPDTAEFEIRYCPAERLLDEDSVWLYLCSFRNYPAFNEEVVNQVLDDLVAALRPASIRVKGSFAPRGGISLITEALFPD